MFDHGCGQHSRRLLKRCPSPRCRLPSAGRSIHTPAPPLVLLCYLRLGALLSLLWLARPVGRRCRCWRLLGVRMCPPPPVVALLALAFRMCYLLLPALACFDAGANAMFSLPCYAALPLCKATDSYKGRAPRRSRIVVYLLVKKTREGERALHVNIFVLRRRRQSLSQT